MGDSVRNFGKFCAKVSMEMQAHPSGARGQSIAEIGSATTWDFSGMFSSHLHQGFVPPPVAAGADVAEEAEDPGGVTFVGRFFAFGACAVDHFSLGRKGRRMLLTHHLLLVLLLLEVLVLVLRSPLAPQMVFLLT